MKIEIEDNGQSGEISAKIDSKKAGFIKFSWVGKDKMNIEHTEVDSEFEGKGIGKKLVLAAVEFARENSLKILSDCPYAKSVLEKDENLKDVLA